MILSPRMFVKCILSFAESTSSSSAKKNFDKKISLYASLIVRTIKEKCKNEVQNVYLPDNPAELGVKIEGEKSNTNYRIYNRLNPEKLDAKPENQLNPGVGFGKQF